MEIQLNLISHSDVNNLKIVIFQKNVATDFDGLAVAWTVVRDLDTSENHPFVFPTQIFVATGDSYGNYTPQLPAQAGQLFELSHTPSGERLALAGPATSASEVQVLNALPQGEISANLYRDGKLVAVKTSIAPQQRAVFELEPTIFIGVVSQVTQGQVMTSAIVSSINTELSLIGIASADIVLTGGAPGRNASPFAFSLENVVMA